MKFKEKTDNSMKKRTLLIILIVLVAVAIVLSIKFNNRKTTKTLKNEAVTNLKSETQTDSGVVSLDPEDDENVTVIPKVEKSSDYVVPGKNTINVKKIAGYNEKKQNKKKKAHKKNNEKGEEKQYMLSDSRISVESVGAYTGNYLEDGSDDPIKNVEAIIITNNSDRMLQVGDICFQVTKKEKAKFRVTNLLPGCSVLVLESNRRNYSKKDDFSYGEIQTAYLEAPTLLEETFDISKENGKLTLHNKTDETYKKVYVYYKYSQMGGTYLGGITYRVPFENIGKKGAAESVANHFNKDTSIIVGVQVN